MFLSRFLTAAALLCSVVLLPAQSPVPVSPAIHARVDALIAKMSVDDKLKLIGGVDGFYTQAIPSIALKHLKMSDGPVGVRTFGPAPAYTAGVALAATWDPTENTDRGLSRINTWNGVGGGGGPRGDGLTTYDYKGEYLPTASGVHVLIASAPEQDTYRVLVDGKEVLSQQRDSNRMAVRNVSVALTEDKPVSIEVVYQTNGTTPRLGVGLVASADMLSSDAQKILHDADAVLVTVGFDASTESEGFDRTYAMPWPQNELIQRVTVLNPKTIVSITAGGSVETAPWIANVPALLHNWYPGQEGSTALAQILFGDHSPEGHLPFSWERTLDQNPASAHYAEEPGDSRIVHYAEGLFLGYRFYTSMNQKPLFPFGFGMSYTNFAFTHLNVKKNSDNDVEVSFSVQNTGSRPGADVAQVYVGDPSAKVKRPLMELKQFSKVRLNAGETQHVVLHLNKRAFSYYDVDAKNWRMDPGEFVIYVGDSSESVPLKQSFPM